MAKLIEHMPLYYRSSKYVAGTTKGANTEILALHAQCDLMRQQFIVDTATELTLSRYEEEYGLPINPGAVSIDARRSRIKSKMRVAGVVTKELFQTCANAWANADVEIIEHYDQYLLEIKFVNIIGRPPHVDDLYKAMQEIIPAHLNVTYTFIYRTHREIKDHPFTHRQLQAYTHRQIREGVIG